MTQPDTGPFQELVENMAGRGGGKAESPARRGQLVAYAALSSLAFSGVWGLAAGSVAMSSAISNLYKVPLVVLLSGLAAAPAGLLATKLSGTRFRGGDLLMGYATAVFGGTLVLAVLSPLVGIYYHTSNWAGPALGVGSACLAIGTGLAVFVRSCLRRLQEDENRKAVIFSVGTFSTVAMAMMLQLISIVAPILPNAHTFDHGVDSLVSQRGE